MKNIYNFPCSVLSDDAAASSIRSLHLSACVFRPTTTLGCLRRLNALSLFSVHITDEGLGHLLSKSFALQQLYIFRCNAIICLKIPSMLQQLKLLTIKLCEKLQVVEINAPRLSSFHFDGALVKISVVDPSPLRPCSVTPLHRRIGDWRGFGEVLTCRGLNPLQSLPNPSQPNTALKVFAATPVLHLDLCQHIWFKKYLFYNRFNVQKMGLYCFHHRLLTIVPITLLFSVEKS